MDDEKLKECANFRKRGRLPTLTFFNKENGCSIWRCSQPKRGLFNQNNKQDSELLLNIAKLSPVNKLHIFDARPYLYAQGNRFQGGGSSSSIQNIIETSFCNIHNIHHIRNVYNSL